MIVTRSQSGTDSILFCCMYDCDTQSVPRVKNDIFVLMRVNTKLFILEKDF